MSSSQIIVLATPVFFLLIAIEFAWGWKRARNTYRLNDAMTSIGLGMLSQITAVFTRLLRVGIYTAVYSAVAIWPDSAFWTTWYGWLLALVFYDFCYYWLHRAGHESAAFWAAHVVHHQSQDYNLSTALRQTSSGALLGWIFYLPMAVAGVPPLVFGVAALVDLLYQFWVHTEHVPKLGWFDRWFCSPSNHRVHHAVNDRYLDRNYGGVLIIWDRIFGTIARIKGSGTYTEVIGTDLGVVGSQQTAPDFAMFQPAISAAVSGPNKVYIDWGWGGYAAFLDACEIQVDRGNGWVLLTIDTTPGYTDSTAHPATLTRWKYRAIYHVDDAQAGLWSAEVSVTVGG